MGGRARKVAAIALGVAAAAQLGIGGAAGQSGGDYERSSSGTRTIELGSGTTITLLLEAANLGDTGIEVGEIVFPAGTSPTQGHQHGRTEIFYVVEGVLGHVVNGEMHRILPGMVGVVKPGDSVEHHVLGDGPVKALVIWVPGGEADRIAPPERWRAIGG